MMAHIQILAIVLCSCFIQDAFPLLDKQTQQQPAGADRQTVRRVKTVKRVNQVSSKDIEAPAPPPETPSKYPNLTAVKDMFWNTFEDINRESEYGQLGVRSVRNTLSNVLSNGLFWSSFEGALKRRVKVTNDAQRADRKIRLCNNITGLVTDPNASQGFQEIANEVYTSVVRMQSEVGTDALRLVTEMVNGGEVTRGLDAISDIVSKIKLNPRMLVKGFAMLRKTLNLGGAMNMSGGLAKGLMSITSKFNK
ncbi:uncharacterized protein LOC111028600 [Myzus persicae]|uniref:uncharacterized protein LOC111028600 n=1 Tax=Myzus persicae TaxID=13164 RepID=UPI000B9395A2|nr:uncharacterized protein LOC111028600 [Myzus persicae]